MGTTGKNKQHGKLSQNSSSPLNISATQTTVATTTKKHNSKREVIALNTTVEYLERLGVCAAAMAGSCAMMYFSEKIFPSASWLPFAIGCISFLLSMILTVWVAFDQVGKMPQSKSKIINFGVCLLVFTPSIFFVLGFIFAAIKGFS